MSIDVDVPPVPQHFAQLSPRSREQMGALVQLRHWLSDMQREAGHTVDLVDIQAIKDGVRGQQVRSVPPCRDLPYLNVLAEFTRPAEDAPTGTDSHFGERAQFRSADEG
jgi:hypothetical protein